MRGNDSRSPKDSPEFRALRASIGWRPFPWNWGLFSLVFFLSVQQRRNGTGDWSGVRINWAINRESLESPESFLSSTQSADFFCV